MRVKEKIWMDRAGLVEHGPINIVIFGDSVSHGVVNGYLDYENVYWNLLKKRLNALRDYIPVNMINSSIDGTTAAASVERLERHVLKHEPDLVIVCFGLNDVNGELEDFKNALYTILEGCRDSGCEVILMTPNMLNTSVADDTPKQYYDYAIKTAQLQNGGRMDAFMSAAVSVARDVGVAVCDCYSRWKEISKKQDVTMLLANRINHPVPSMHHLFADSLYEIIIGNSDGTAESDDAMFKE